MKTTNAKTGDALQGIAGRRLTRRTFLGHTGALALGAGLAGALPGLAEAQQNATLRVNMGPSAVLPPLCDMFKAKTGINIYVAPYISATDTISKLLAPGGTRQFDVMSSLTDFARPAVVQDKLLGWTDKDVPNSRYIMPHFRSDILTKNGHNYTIPFYWGYNTILINRKYVPENDPGTQSWGLLFDNRYKGRVAMRDDPLESIQMTAIYLGYKDTMNLSRSDLDDVVKFLVSKKRNIRTLWSQFAQAIQLMASGEVVAMYGWILMRTTLQRQGFDVVNNWPKEGIQWWAQSAYISKDTSNPDAAYKWVNFLLSKDYGAQLTKLNGGILSASSVAQETFPPADRAKLGYDLFQRKLVFVREGLPNNYGWWIEAWSRFKTA